MQFETIDGPAAWQGQQLFETQQWPVQLTAADLDELTTAAANTATLPLADLSRDNFELPQFAPKLAALQTELEEGCGAILIKGHASDRFSADDSQRMFYGLTTHLGTAVSQSSGGDIIFDVRDEGYKTDNDKTRGPNTSKRLSFHTDRCDVIAFLCLQQAISGGENQIVSSVAVYNQILSERPDLLQILTQPFYYKRHNVDTRNAEAYCQQPIFSFCAGQFASAFLRVLIDRAYADHDMPDMTAPQKEALDFVEEVCERPTMHVEFRQEPGDILLLNNWVTYHRRNAFQDHKTIARRRHLLRIWLAMPNSRPLDPAFLANYGAVEAGAIRGGMHSTVE
jgi:alpha-ketoglutarate-dependent taurine dioxygenase|tara:strand:+ start:1468 stop:2481 length:1014 start_codon:yes stop_codon:yes gene_type:complete